MFSACLATAGYAAPFARTLSDAKLRDYVAAFNRTDEELYTNSIPNAAAADFLADAVPRFECPDAEIERTYYFRWWTYRKHLRQTPDGWVVTEFLPDVGWAGKHNTISCPLGHHLREGRWLRDGRYLDDYTRFMVRQGNVAGTKAYACWPAWAALERERVTGDTSVANRLADDFVRNYETWERGWSARIWTSRPVSWLPTGYKAERGLFDFDGNHEGTEFALSPEGARPMVNAAMWAEAQAISAIAARTGRPDVAARFASRAKGLEEAIRNRLWNEEKDFFVTLTTNGVQDSVCELHGYAPFYFRLPLDARHAVAWNRLMREDGFFAPKGLTFPARSTPGFRSDMDLSRHECLWDGPSWPYATSVALTALYETLQGEASCPIGAKDFVTLLRQYAQQHVRVREDGTTVPWIDEDLDPFTGEWLARRIMIEKDRKGLGKLMYRERGKDYNHSTFCDLVIAGLCGLVPQADGSVVVRPLAPPEWDWWCVDGVRYHGRDLTVLYDRDGTRYGKGKGLVVLSGRDRSAVSAHASFYGKIDTVEPVWKADLADLTVEKRNGAEGFVSVEDGVIKIDKRNAAGEIVVRAKPFPVAKGRQLRFVSEVSASGAKWRQCFGMLRAYGGKEDFGNSPLDWQEFIAGNRIVNWELVNTAKGDFVRKIELFESADGFATPVIVVRGEPSQSVWRNWRADDRAAADAAWKPYLDTVVDLPPDAQVSEDELKERLRADVDHTAKIERVDGFSRLFLDGKQAVPYLYHGDYIENCGEQLKQFRGAALAKNGVPLMTVSVRLGPVGVTAGAWTKDGFDLDGIVRDVKDAMRMAPDSPFLLALGVVAYPEFIEKEHPEEAWIKADGTPLRGSGSSSTTYCDTSVGDDGKTKWTWPSFASRVWRDAVNGKIGQIVAALRKENLTKRIVGVHLFGYHDCQFTVGYDDISRPAKEEYARYLAEPGNLSTNYAYFCRQLATRAVNEFARTFKRAMGKDVVAVRWLESPNRGDPVSSWDIGSFCRSDALDAIVCQPWYEHRLPGMCCGSHVPFSSLHLHGKMFWDEIDFRNYAALGRTVDSEMDFVGLGAARDFDEWTKVFEKEANVMTGNRMGFWFLDKMRGAFSEPSIAKGIGAEADFRKGFESRKASAWRPSVAFVVDEMALHGWPGKEAKREEGWRRQQIYFNQVEFLKAAGVPFEIYLAEDVLTHPERLAHVRVTLLAHFRKVDEVRRRFIDAMRTEGRTVVALADTGRLGGKPDPAKGIVFVDEPMGLKPADLNRLAMEAGAYVALPPDVAQVTANGEFLALHALTGGTFDLVLPWGERRAVAFDTGDNLRFVRELP